jgi:hypothetical protein
LSSFPCKRQHRFQQKIPILKSAAIVSKDSTRISFCRRQDQFKRTRRDWSGRENCTDDIELLKNFLIMPRHFMSWLVSPSSSIQKYVKTNIVTAASGGISLKMLVRGVFQTEVEIEKWILADRRNRLVEEQRRSEVDE